MKKYLKWSPELTIAGLGIWHAASPALQHFVVVFLQGHPDAFAALGAAAVYLARLSTSPLKG